MKSQQKHHIQNPQSKPLPFTINTESQASQHAEDCVQWHQYCKQSKQSWEASNQTPAPSGLRNLKDQRKLWLPLSKHCFTLKWVEFISGMSILNSILLLIIQCRLSVAQARSSFKCLDMRMTSMHTALTFNWSTLSCYLYTTVLTTVTVKVTAYTVLAYSY